MRSIRNLDISGYVVLAIFALSAGLLLFPFARWAALGSDVRSGAYFIRQVEREPPAGYQTFLVPIEPRIEYVRYTGRPLFLDLRHYRPMIPFEINVTVSSGVAEEIVWSYPDPPQLNHDLDKICKRWNGKLRFAFAFDGTFKVLIYPDLTWRIEWEKIGHFPMGNSMVCYAVSKYAAYSEYLLPIRGLGPLTKISVPPEYSKLARRCRNQLGLPANTQI